MARYGQAYKDRIVARLLPPESSAVEVVSREVGVSVATLERWRADALATDVAAAVNAGRLRRGWRRCSIRLRWMKRHAAPGAASKGCIRANWMVGSRMPLLVWASRVQRVP